MLLPTTGPVTIRGAAPGEAPAVLDLMRRAFAEYRGRLDPESSVFAETEAAIAAKLGGCGGFVAARGVLLLGCVIAEDRGDCGYLGRLAVDPGHRRQGIAQRLVDAAERWLRARGLGRVELNVRIALPRNIAFFESLFYRETARAAHPGWPHPTFLVMEKTLE